MRMYLKSERDRLTQKFTTKEREMTSTIRIATQPLGTTHITPETIFAVAVEDRMEPEHFGHLYSHTPNESPDYHRPVQRSPMNNQSPLFMRDTNKFDGLTWEDINESLHANYHTSTPGVLTLVGFNKITAASDLKQLEMLDNSSDPELALVSKWMDKLKSAINASKSDSESDSENEDDFF